MKVTITPEFQAQYDELFADLQLIVGSSVPAISDLATYFNALDYARNNSSVSWKFYRLPLEEGTFNVDMSSRMISVPPEFQNYGLGVKGDANAEVVWFKVSRWFDTMDLGVQECWVQWQNAKTSGNSPVVLKDSVEDELYLGWVITPDMTAQSGNLEFALRFFTIDKDESGNDYVKYSLSTQKATCAIKNTLSLDVLNTKIDDQIENLILTRPIYSGVINSMDGAAPIITMNLDNTKEYDLLTEGALYEAFKDQYPNGVCEFKVAAISPDAVVNDEGETTDGFIRYRWYRGRDLQTDITLTLDDDGADFVATKAGTYFAQIGNEKKGSGTRWINSNTVVIPAANEIKRDGAFSFPTRAYSVDPEGDYANRYQEIKFAVTGKDGSEPNGEVKYTWILTALDDENSSRELSAEDGVNGSVYVPEVDTEGRISCSAQNHKNNTTSDAVATEYSCVLRAYPRVASSVAASWDGAKTLSCTPVFEGPSANHPDEWKYQWFRVFTPSSTGTPSSSNVTAQEGGTSASFSPTLQKPASGVNRYEFECSVSHVVYSNVTGFSATSTPKYSNTIVLTIDSAGNVQQVEE